MWRWPKPRPNNRNISEHCWTQHVVCVWPRCCVVLRHFATRWVLLAQIWNGQIFHAIFVFHVTFLDVAWCCSRLARFVKECCTRACALTTSIATKWPNVRNMLRPAIWRYVVLKCCDHLAGACKCWANDVAICCDDMLIAIVWSGLEKSPKAKRL